MHNSNCPGVPIGATTLPEVLASAGYATHLVGKWHAGFHHPVHSPARRGFTSGLGYYGGSIVHSSHCSQKRRACARRPHTVHHPHYTHAAHLTSTRRTAHAVRREWHRCATWAADGSEQWALQADGVSPTSDDYAVLYMAAHGALPHRAPSTRCTA